MPSTPTAKSSSVTTGPALKPVGHHEGKPAIRLSRPVYIIGSRSSCRIHLVSSSVSKAHALLVRSNGRTYIRDLASRSKVYINGDEARESNLCDGDLIKIGTFTFQYIAGPGEERSRIQKEAPPAKFEVSGAELPILIDERVLVMGRRTRCDIHLLEDTVSTSHAVIFEMDGQRYVRDLGSRTGTYVNGVSTHQHMLTAHDTLRVGDNELRYVLTGAAPAAVIEDEPTSPAQLAAAIAAAAPVVEALAPVEEITPLAEPLEAVTTEEAAPLEVAADDVAIPLETEEPAVEAVIPLEPELESPAPVVPQPVVKAARKIEEVIPLDESIAIEPEEEPVAEVASALVPEIDAIEDEIAPEPVVEVAEPVDALTSADEPIAIDVDEPEEPTAVDAVEELSPEPVTDVVPELTIPTESTAKAQLEPLYVVEPDIEELTPEVAEAPTVPAKEEIEEPLEIAEAPRLVELPTEPVEAIDDFAIEPLAAKVVPEVDLDLDAVGMESAEVEEAEADALNLIADDLTASTETSKIDEPAISLSTDVPVDEFAAPEEPQADLALPTLDEAEEVVAPEPVLDLSPAHQAEVIEPVIEAKDELPLEVAESDEPEPLATVEAAGHDELPLAPELEHVEEVVSDVEAEGPSDDLAFEKPAIDLVAPPAQELSAEPILPDETSEVIDATEPTPQSALQSAADQLALDALAGPDAPLQPIADELTDTQFHRAVREFSGTGLGELVEPKAHEDVLETPAIEEAAPSETDAPSDEATSADELAELLPEIEPLAEEAAPSAESAVTDEAISVDALADLLPDLEPVADAPAELAAELPEIESSGPIAAIEEPPSEIEPLAELDLPPAEPAAPVANVEQASPPAPKSDAPRPRVPWGANQDNFLGGAPISLGHATPEPAPQQRPAVPPPVPAKAAARAPDPVPANEQAVEDLIKEIDHAAAAAEAASTTPPPPPPSAGDAAPIAPILPPRPRRSGPRPQRRRQAPLIATEETESPARDLVNTGFDGLANSPLRDMDVFSRPGSHAADEVTDTPLSSLTSGPATAGGVDLATEPAVETTPTRRSRVTPELAGDTAPASERRPQVSYAAELTEAETTAIRRRYHRRVYMLLALMIALIGASCWAINSYMAANTTVEASMKYQNLQALTKRQQLDMQERLLGILRHDGTRRLARQIVGQTPEVDPGFLAEVEDFDRTLLTAGFSDARPEMLVIRTQSRDPDQERRRIAALLQAQYQLNMFLVDDAKRAQRELRELTAAIEREEGRLKTINDEMTRLRIADQSRPTNDQIKVLQEEASALEAQAAEAYAKVVKATAELEQLKTAPASIPDPGTGVAPAADDDKLRTMDTLLKELQKKLADDRAATSTQAADARRALDGKLDAFQKEVASAQGMMNGNPALTAFIQDAQRLQETTRQITDDLIRRQETQIARLIELKDRQSDRLEQRRKEIWQGDQQLRDMTERRAIAMREYNAAVGGGLKEAEDRKAQLDLISSMIKARQELLPGDQFFADMIRELQEVIDSTRKDIQEDRRRTEELLANRQQAFATSQAIRNLPQEQKLLASQLQQKLQDVTEARKQYNAAIDVGTTDGDSQTKSQIATLQAAIDARRGELADATAKGTQAQQEQARQAAIQPKQEDLTRLKEAEAQASAAFVEKNRELTKARATQIASADNEDKLASMFSEKDRIERQLTTYNDQKENKLRAAQTTVEPIAPSVDAVSTIAGNDRRTIYMGVSAAGIGLIFCVLIFLTLHTASVEAPPASIQAADLRPEQPAGNGDVAKADKTNDDEEDHEPAVV